MSIPSKTQNTELLLREKYSGNFETDLSKDLERLAKGEPLAYVIGWIPFLGLKIGLDSKPLIPRPETEWWTDMLITHLRERFGENSFRLLDLCAGSGAIGLSVLAKLPNAQVSFGELFAEHIQQIWTNLRVNALDESRADIRQSDLFESFIENHFLTEQNTEDISNTRFNIIVCNPPYIPVGRKLPESISAYEQHEALFAGSDGLEIIKRIVMEAHNFLGSHGELWVECDVSNIGEAAKLIEARGAKDVAIHEDLYGRRRLIVGQFD